MACAPAVAYPTENDALLANRNEKRPVARFVSTVFPVATILFCTLVMVAGGTLTKMLTSLPPWQIIAIRNAAQTPIAFIIYFCVHYKQHYDRQHPFSAAILRRSGAKLIARGLSGAFASICFVLAVQNLPFGDANAIVLSSPVLVAIWAYCILPNERLSIVIIFGLVLTLTGVTLVSQPEFLFGNRQQTTSSNKNANFLLGVVAAICCALICSCNAILSRTLRYEKATLLLIYYSVIGFVVNFCITTFTGTWTSFDSGRTWLLMLGVCALGCFQQYLVLFSFQLGNANVVSIMFTLEIVWGYITQIVVFGETPRLLNLLGAALILITAVMVAVEKLLTTTKSSSKVNHVNDNVETDTGQVLTEATAAPLSDNNAERAPLLISSGATGRE